MSLKNSFNVLLVEDDEEDKFLTVEALRDVAGINYNVTWVTNAPEAIEALRAKRFDVALLDFRLGAYTALDILAGVRDQTDTPCVLLTGQRDHETDVKAMEAGAADYMVKADLNPVEIERTIRYAVDRFEDMRSLRESEVRFRTVVEAASDAIMLTSDDGHLLTWNRATLSFFGLDPESAPGTKLTDLLSFEGSLSELQELVADQTDDLRGRRIDGATFPVSLSLASWDTTDGRLWSAIARDVSAQRSLEERIVHQAFHDPLTKLANRALFADRLNHALAKLEWRKGMVSVMMLDIDDFKRVNDSFGHVFGDEILNMMGERLVGCVHSNDSVARFGGDEFGILIDDADDPRVAYTVADRIMKSMSQPFTLGGRDVYVTASIGITISTTFETTATDVLRDADLAMYAAKETGRNRIQLFEDNMHASIMDRVEIENDLRGAAERGEIVAHYQPIMDLATGRLKGFEALARWHHPAKGVLSPVVFIDIAESNGMIVPIGESILNQACRQVTEWQRQYPDRGLLTVSVNLSSRQIEEPGVVDVVALAISSSGISPSSLILEITESLVVEHNSESTGRLAALAELGIGIAVDDFGTGYSSLAYLQDLPLTVLKVDRSFVSRMDEQKGRSLVQAIVAMSKSLGLQTIAEGIETDAQHRSLSDYGCTFGQGYLFARPMTVEDVENMLRSDCHRIEPAPALA